jgi:nitrite reductase/ring-hydroxylating ferredoxin subunit
MQKTKPGKHQRQKDAVNQGKLEGREIVCPFHKARFDVTTAMKIADPWIPVPKTLKMVAIIDNFLNKMP